MVYANLSCFAWYLGTSWNLYLGPLLGTLEPFGTFTWNPYLEPLTPWNLYAEPWLGTLEPSETLPVLGIPFWNLDWELLLGTFQALQLSLWNLGTSWNPYFLLGAAEPSEPGTLSGLEPLLGTLTWNLGTSRNLAGWLPQSAPGPSLADAAKLSAVREKTICQSQLLCIFTAWCFSLGRKRSQSNHFDLEEDLDLEEAWSERKGERKRTP